MSARFQFSIRMGKRGRERGQKVGSLADSNLFYGSLVARLAFKINVQCTYGFLRFVRIAEMDVLVGRGIGEARVCCVRVCMRACVYTACIYIYIYIRVPRFRNEVYAFFEGYSDEDARTYVCIGYIERYRVARSDVEESSDLKRAIYTEEWKTDYK